MLTGVVNNPRSGWLEYLGLPEDLDEWTLDDVRSSVSSYVTTPRAAGDAVLPPPTQRLLTLSDFKEYLTRVGEPYRFLAASRPQDGAAPDGAAAEVSDAAALDAAEQAAALKAVPAICFQEEFDLTAPATFASFSPPDQPHAVTTVTLEKLNGYLDTVELTLLSEVSSRSDGFFETLASYEQLRGEVAAGCARIEELRAKIRSLESNLVDKSLRVRTPGAAGATPVSRRAGLRARNASACAWVRGCVGAWVRGCVGAWVCGCVGVSRRNAPTRALPRSCRRSSADAPTPPRSWRSSASCMRYGRRNRRSSSC